MTSYRQLADIELMEDTVLAARQRRRVGGCVAMLISGALELPRLVPTALETGLSPELTLENIDFGQWVPLGSIRGNVIDLNKHRIRLDGIMQPPWTITMYFTPKIIIKHRLEPPETDWRMGVNTTLNTFNSGHVDWHGNVLFIKHSAEEPYSLNDCSPEDMDLIIQGVIQYVGSIMQFYWSEAKQPERCRQFKGPEAPVQKIRDAVRHGDIFSDSE